ncbi:MAG: hypothetical protein IPJ34_23625 [Myxococcales bacterium]|nr:hypothetical protein [Myxococcales bacterium]
MTLRAHLAYALCASTLGSMPRVDASVAGRGGAERVVSIPQSKPGH